MSNSTTQRLLTKMSVFVMLRNEAGDILLQQRENTGYMDGCWDMAATGHVEYGESIQEAAIRELDEEIGIKAIAKDLRLVLTYQAYLDTPYANFIFVLRKWKGVPVIREPHKCSGLEYFSPNNLPGKLTRGVRMMQATGFSDNLSFAKLTPENYRQYMGEDYSG